MGFMGIMHMLWYGLLQGEGGFRGIWGIWGLWGSCIWSVVGKGWVVRQGDYVDYGDLVVCGSVRGEAGG